MAQFLMVCLIVTIALLGAMAMLYLPLSRRNNGGGCEHHICSCASHSPASPHENQNENQNKPECTQHCNICEHKE